ELTHEWRVERVQTALDRHDSGKLLARQRELSRVGDDDVDAVRQAQLELGTDLLHCRIIAPGRPADAHTLTRGALRIRVSAQPEERGQRCQDVSKSANAFHDVTDRWRVSRNNTGPRKGDTLGPAL